MPELSAGVNCTFEDLSEMDGLVVGSQIQCMSPAAKEVPQIITENGECSPAPLPPVLTEQDLAPESLRRIPGEQERCWSCTSWHGLCECESSSRLPTHPIP